MDYLLLGIILFILFFSLRTNYKISNLEEKLKKNNQKQKEDMEKTLSKIKVINESMEKKIVFLQKTLNDFRENQDKSTLKSQNVLKKQLATIKNDTELIKTLYLKPDKKLQETNDTVELGKNKEATAVKETPLEDSNTIKQEEKYVELFSEKVKEKLKKMSGDEIWLLKQLLSQAPLQWQNVSEMEDEVSMPKFKIPKLSRQFIIDGLPILMIKHAGDKMFVKWGEGLTSDKIVDVQNEIRGDW
ncbi:MAG: hypothetical protein U9N62_10005 [Thermotogota bacterium]|nr:hypothetical protein [Thermotogota bacterium]